MFNRNNVLLEDKTKTFSGFNDNDNITCIATPNDIYGAKGEAKKAQTMISESSITVRIMKPLLNIVGVNANAKQLNSGTNLNAITGMVTGQNEDSGITLIFLLGIFLIILGAINVIFLFRHSNKPLTSGKF